MKRILKAMSMVLTCLPLMATAAKTNRIELVEQPVPVSAVVARGRAEACPWQPGILLRHLDE
jgi:hypothetical protein